MTISSVTSARNILLPDDGLRTETCRSVFNVLMCKFYTFYICAVVGVIIEYFNITSILMLYLYIINLTEQGILKINVFLAL